MRTAWMFQVFIASTDAWSTGPLSHMPLPCTQENSPPERLTPSSRYGLPLSVTILLPETCSAGAGPLAGGVLVVVVVVVVVVGGVPVHAAPLTAKSVGLA